MMGEEYTNYIIDENCVNHECSPSFWAPAHAVLVSCPICRACKHEVYTGHSLECDLYSTGKELVRGGRYFLCEGYVPKPESDYYKMVQKEISEAEKNK